MEPFEFINKHKKHIKCWPSGLTYDKLSDDVKIQKFMIVHEKKEDTQTES
jgi:hypothetical protein